MAARYLSDRVYDGIRTMTPEQAKAHRKQVDKLVRGRPANQDMIEGYMDGRDKDAPEPEFIPREIVRQIAMDIGKEVDELKHKDGQP